MRFHTIPLRLFASRLPTGAHEFFCYIQLAPDNTLSVPSDKITWEIMAKDNEEALVSGTISPSEQTLATGRIPIAAVLPHSWDGGSLHVSIQTASETSRSSCAIHHYTQQVRFQLPVTGLSLIVSGHRIGEVHRLAWQVYSQQFAWDLLPLTGQMWSILGSPPVNQLRPQDFACFGSSILSPAKGKIVRVVGDQCDLVNVGELPPTDAFIEDCSRALGNYIVIDHGGNVWSLLAHLLQNSLQVQVGETVETGQEVGRLGNSGFSSGPHLHLHFMDGPDPLTASPLPVELDVEGQTYAPQAGELVMN